jgi:hypothetical protein
MKLDYTNFFAGSFRGFDNSWFSLSLPGKAHRERKCCLSSIIKNLTSFSFCNINVGRDSRLRKIKARRIIRGFKMISVRCQTREIIKPFLRPNIHIPHFGG